jgi:hypothetical protein
MTRRQMVYLHGFASSPRSSKASWFAARAEAAGIGFACPDLNAPAFETLTISRMLDQVEATIGGMPEGPIALVGSSLGALVALFAAERRGILEPGAHVVDRLVLLAPALDLVPSLERHFGPERLALWAATGKLEVFHYGEEGLRTLGYTFFADARAYDAFAVTTDTPTLVFQGRRDPTVDAAMVERWARTRRHVTLHLLDDDHQLLDSLETLWDGTRAFLVPAG